MKTGEQNPSPEKGISTQERLGSIFRLITSYPPAESALQAQQLLSKAFAAVENPLSAAPESDIPMTVSRLDRMETTHYGNTRIWQQSYFKHVLFIGENGSIEIRSKDEKTVPAPMDPSPYADQLLVFEKAGADGRKVWELTVSD